MVISLNVKQFLRIGLRIHKVKTLARFQEIHQTVERFVAQKS